MVLGEAPDLPELSHRDPTVLGTGDPKDVAAAQAGEVQPRRLQLRSGVAPARGRRGIPSMNHITQITGNAE